MSIRIFSKKSFAIGPGAARGTTEVDYFVTKPNAFQDMPDKYVNDRMFKMAVKAGDITIIGSEKVENVEAKNEAKVEEKVMSEEEAFYEELKAMSLEDATTLAEEKYGITPKNGETVSKLKKRIMAAYKKEKSEE